MSCTIPVIVEEVFFLQCKNVIELAIFLNIVVVIDKVWSNLAKVLQRVPCSKIDWRYVEKQSGLHIDEPLHYDGNGMKWLITEYSYIVYGVLWCINFDGFRVGKFSHDFSSIKLLAFSEVL